ncbi:MAG: exodeoxyribonuclease VII small subunit [Candidatus Saccharimonas sp.]
MSEKNDKSITGKMEQLRELVTWFDSEEFELELALDKYKQAEKLADEIKHDLSELKNQVSVLKQKFSD